MEAYIVAIATEIEDGNFDYHSVHDNEYDAFRAVVQLADKHPNGIPCILTPGDYEEDGCGLFMGCYVFTKDEFNNWDLNENTWNSNGDFMIHDYDGFDYLDANKALNEPLDHDPVDGYIISTFYFYDEYDPKIVVDNKDDLLKHVKNLYFDMGENVIIHKSCKKYVTSIDEACFETADKLSEEDIRKVIDNL